MANSSLNETVDSWTAQAAQASGHLMRLYRTLGDERQVYIASQASGLSEERTQRLKLQTRIAALNVVFVNEYPEETHGEEKAWQLLIEANAGLSAFHGLVDDHEQGGCIRGARTATNKAFHKALRGYRTAFPEEMTIPGVQQAIEQAALRCAETFSFEVDGTTDQEKSDLRKELHGYILEALRKEVGDPE